MSCLWHGANWTYILWGMVHGVVHGVVLMLGTKSVDNSDKIIKIPSWVKVCMTFVLCNLAGRLFRTETLRDALCVYQNMLYGINDGII